MKKIAVLLALFCATALNTMENPKGNDYKGLGGLPPEIQVKILSYLNTYGALKHIIKGIKSLSLVDKELNCIVNDEYGNPTGFDRLIHILAEKYKNRPRGLDRTPNGIAKRFQTITASNYLKAQEILFQGLLQADTEKIKQAIQLGVMVNRPLHSPFNGLSYEPLELAVSNKSPEHVKILLEAGAKANKKWINKNTYHTPELNSNVEKTNQLLKEAIEKRQ